MVEIGFREPETLVRAIAWADLSTNVVSGQPKM
jgi:hypothetical protein